MPAILLRALVAALCLIPPAFLMGYMAGLALNVNSEDAIYSEMLRHRRWPANLFTGTDDTLRKFRARLQ